MDIPWPLILLRYISTKVYLLCYRWEGLDRFCLLPNNSIVCSIVKKKFGMSRKNQSTEVCFFVCIRVERDHSCEDPSKLYIFIVCAFEIVRSDLFCKNTTSWFFMQRISGVFRPTREFFTHFKTSPLPVKGCKFWLMLGTYDNWAKRVL